ncbi:MAG: leucyl aminopeptidase [Candidatus Accumulibacter sp.]|nr:leucyl aminopeptidase [Accumulibacter sp.]
MEFSIKSSAAEKGHSACLVLGVFESRKPAPAAWTDDPQAQRALADVLASGDMDGKANHTLMLRGFPVPDSERLLLVGLGKEEEFGDRAYMTAIRNAVKALQNSGATDATLLLTRIPVKGRSAAWRIRQAVVAAGEALYRFDRFKSEKDEPRPLDTLFFAIDDQTSETVAAQALAQGRAIDAGTSLAKTLGNLPANVCTPAYLADAARRIAEEHRFDCEVLERDDMEKLGMNSLLSVAQGSRQAPKFVVMQYPGGKSGDPPVVLIGKGVCFDSGGISLKPGEGMGEMKFDMCGAASVLGTLDAAARLRLPLNLVALAPCVENMPGGAASRPGDIVTSLSGQTIEILNTDAEGRLILCDALTYAERFDPQAVIDVATLTGACVVALGHIASGLFANDDALAGALLEAGDTAFDRAWRLPLWDDYREQLKSEFADLANIGGRPAGSVTAACFLSRFARKFPWAHLDVAGTARKSGTKKGVTGRPVPLLTHFLLARTGKLR